MTLSDISTKISQLTKSDTNSYPNTQRLVDINIWYQKTVTNILRSNDEWDYDDTNKSDFPILIANFVANQQDYALPTNAIVIKRVEVSYDSSTWYRAEPMDINERGTATSTSLIAADFVQSQPYYDTQYGSVFVYPIPPANVTGGIKIWIGRTITEFTSSDLTTGTLSPGFDIMFHSLLAYGPAYEYAIANNLPSADRIKLQLDELNNNLSVFYSQKVEDRILMLNPAFHDYGTLRYTGSIRRYPN